MTFIDNFEWKYNFFQFLAYLPNFIKNCIADQIKETLIFQLFFTELDHNVASWVSNQFLKIYVDRNKRRHAGHKGSSIKISEAGLSGKKKEQICLVETDRFFMLGVKIGEMRSGYI